MTIDKEYVKPAIEVLPLGCCQICAGTTTTSYPIKGEDNSGGDINVAGKDAYWVDEE